MSAPGEVVLSLADAGLRFGQRTLWDHLDLDVRAGEVVAVLGGNGTGKSSLLKVILGQVRLTSGSVRVLGRPVDGGSRRVGYVPQQTLATDVLPLRGRDLVGLGLDGDRWGIGLPSRRRRRVVDDLLASVHAGGEADRRLGLLSGGEQQRMRMAQALAGDPRLLLCDEPLLSLDLAHQRVVCELVDESRRARDLAVLFVTHDVNPLLGIVDRVLYLAGGRFRVGTPDEVLRSDVLTDLYGSPVEVVRAQGRLVVVGGHDHGDEGRP